MLPPNASGMANSNKIPLGVRWAGLLWGMLTLAWLPKEDTDIIFITLLSLGWCLWIAFWLRDQDRFSRLNKVLMGAILGALFLPLALLLIFVKAGLHGHGFLDFSLTQITHLVPLTPVWMLFGGAAGAIFRKQTKMRSN